MHIDRLIVDKTAVDKLAAARNFSGALVRSFGQVIFTDKLSAGLLCIVAVGLAAPHLLLGAILGAVSSLLAAALLRYEKADLFAGLYGYNGVLIGLAVPTFFQLSIGPILLLVTAASLSSPLLRLLIRGPLPPYTAPFILLSWLLFGIADFYSMAPAATAGNYDVLTVPWLDAAANGVGQVFFLANPWSGLCLMLALLISGRQLLLWSLAASLSGYFLAQSLALADPAVIGLYGYNPVLAALALAIRFPGKPLLIISGILLAQLLMLLIQNWLAVPLTAPFVVAAWLFFLITQLIESRRQSSRQQLAGE
ncbi:urea transporter [Marinobacterium arenosum]|uniref:urea transporter n=1 Tax=Marinobacterium arenosum TaxID=2862496 RepID=UPI001C9474A6|nr:urea transporter [Marinobacterium arenosum]MBY4678149.1 urea transporter [Marinobacterium arenosum]